MAILQDVLGRESRSLLRYIDDAYPWTTAGAWTVFAVWAFAAAILAVTAVYRRDV